MAVTKGTTTTTPTPEPNQAIERAKGFWDKYSKPIIYVGAAIILIIAAFYAYVNFIKVPKEKKADDAIYAAEAIFDKMASTQFSKDSVDMALNGRTTPEGKKITGLLKVISNYDGTKSANRAKYMVGASYLQLKEYDKAIKYLKDFDGNDAAQVQCKAYEMLGHAYAELKKTDEALNYYKKAAAVDEKDEAFTANALMMAAQYAGFTGKTKDAVEMYKKLKDKYPNHTSVTSGDVDKQLARFGELQND